MPEYINKIIEYMVIPKTWSNRYSAWVNGIKIWKVNFLILNLFEKRTTIRIYFGVIKQYKPYISHELYTVGQIKEMHPNRFLIPINLEYFKHKGRLLTFSDLKPLYGSK